MNDESTLHSGHRKRQRELFENLGLDAFADHGVIELLLYYVIPRKDTNLIAHRLINRFESLAGVFEATVEELEKVEGMGHQAALLLNMMSQVSARYMKSRTERSKILINSPELCKYFMNRYYGERSEVVYLATFDARGRFISCHKISEGSVTSASITARTVAEKALADNAVYVVLSHNHVGGYALPSGEDISTTETLYGVLESIGVQLFDHLIFDDGDDYVSMRQSGFLTRIENKL